MAVGRSAPEVVVNVKRALLNADGSACLFSGATLGVAPGMRESDDCHSHSRQTVLVHVCASLRIAIQRSDCRSRKGVRSLGRPQHHEHYGRTPGVGPSGRYLCGLLGWLFLPRCRYADDVICCLIRSRHCTNRDTAAQSRGHGDTQHWFEATTGRRGGKEGSWC